MAFFDELTKKAKDVAAVAADRAKDAAEVAKGAAAVRSLTASSAPTAVPRWVSKPRNGGEWAGPETGPACLCEERKETDRQWNRMN